MNEKRVASKSSLVLQMYGALNPSSFLNVMSFPSPVQLFSAFSELYWRGYGSDRGILYMFK